MENKIHKKEGVRRMKLQKFEKTIKLMEVYYEEDEEEYENTAS